MGQGLGAEQVGCADASSTTGCVAVPADFGFGGRRQGQSEGEGGEGGRGGGSLASVAMLPTCMPASSYRSTLHEKAHLRRVAGASSPSAAPAPEPVPLPQPRPHSQFVLNDSDPPSTPLEQQQQQQQESTHQARQPPQLQVWSVGGCSGGLAAAVAARVSASSGSAPMSAMASRNASRNASSRGSRGSGGDDRVVGTPEMEGGGGARQAPHGVKFAPQAIVEKSSSEEWWRRPSASANSASSALSGPQFDGDSAPGAWVHKSICDTASSTSNFGPDSADVRVLARQLVEAHDAALATAVANATAQLQTENRSLHERLDRHEGLSEVASSSAGSGSREATQQMSHASQGARKRGHLVFRETESIVPPPRAGERGDEEGSGSGAGLGSRSVKFLGGEGSGDSDPQLARGSRASGGSRRSSDRKKALSWDADDADGVEGTGSGPPRQSSTSMANFELHQHWEEYPMREVLQNQKLRRGITKSMALLTSPKTMKISRAKLSTMNSFLQRTPVQKKRTCSERIMSNPGNRWRMPWEILGMILVLYDAIIIPLGVFDINKIVFMTVMEWMARIYWTCDIPMQFTVGYFHDGEIIMDPKRVALNYLKGTFMLDVFIVVVDWFLQVGDTNEMAAGNAGILRIFRAARILRLLRLFKLQKVLIFVQDHVNSEYVGLIFDFAKLVSAVLLLSHFAACIFWWVGISGSNQRNWIKDTDLEDRETSEQYTASLYFSLMSFLLESTVNPQSAGEYLYCISCVVIGLILFSTIISRITSLLLEIQNMSADKTQELWKLRRFFRQKKVPTDLSRRITRYLEYHHEQKRRMIQWSELPILDNLTPVLRNQLHYVDYMQHLRAHPLLRFVEHLSDVTMQRVSENAVSEQALADRDPLFFQGELASSVEVLTRGSLLYLQRPSNDFEGKQRTYYFDKLDSVGFDEDEEFEDDLEMRGTRRRKVVAGTFLAESALWVKWYCMGDAYAITECSTISLAVESFAETIKRSSYVHCQLARYAARAQSQIQRLHARGTLSDIWDKSRSSSILDASVRDMIPGEYGDRSTAVGDGKRGSRGSQGSSQGEGGVGTVSSGGSGAPRFDQVVFPPRTSGSSSSARNSGTSGSAGASAAGRKAGERGQME